MTGGALTGMITMLWHAAGLGGAIIWASAIGLPIRRRIIRKWAKPYEPRTLFRRRVPAKRTP